MSFINFKCIVCEKNLTTNDEIVSTHCGHVFHGACLKKHQKERSFSLFRTPQCPQCLSEIKNTFRLHLNFEETSGLSKEHQIAELRSQIDFLYKTRDQIHHELSVTKKELQNMQGKFETKNKEVNEINKRMELLRLQLKDHANDNASKTIEIHKLKETLNSKNQEPLSTAFQEEINVLKEKNKQITLELAKEIRHSSQLSMDKIRLESWLEFTNKSSDKEIKENVDKKDQAETTKRTEFTRKQQTAKIRNTINANEEESSNEDYVKSVVIKNIKITFDDNQAMKSYAYKLCDIMGLNFTEGDIENVINLNSNFQANGTTIKTSLVVKFKNVSMKSWFLSRKDKLKQHEEMKQLFLYEYVDDAKHSLFQQAKNLRSLGYNHVYCRNNVVLVKKHRRSPEIIIKSRDDIEKLKAEIENPT